VAVGNGDQGAMRGNAFEQALNMRTCMHQASLTGPL
jgi:hypothetical protein